jgi:cell division protein FtsQ
MDKDKNYIPPRASRDSEGSGYGRKVYHQTERNDEYNIERARKELNRKRSSQKREREEERRRKKIRMRAMRMRAALIAAALVVLALILLFFTPIMNIKNISAAGNNIVKTEEITQRLESLKGKNLITLSESTVRDQLSDLSYIEDISVAKFLIPPSIRVDVEECTPAARIELNGYNVILDSEMKILSDSNEFDADTLPRLEGLSVSKYSIGKKLTLADNDSEKLEVLGTCLDIMNRLGMIPKIDYIDLTDVTNIRFGYDDRIDAVCGTRLDLERKIRMFNATVTGGNLADNARGVIDLTTSGNAVYTP